MTHDRRKASHSRLSNQTARTAVMLALISSAPAAHAQLVEIGSCVQISQDAQRLACYDALAGQTVKKTEPVVPAERAPAQTADAIASQTASSQQPALQTTDALTAAVGDYVTPQERVRQRAAANETGEQNADEAKISTTIRRHQRLSTGKIALELENGQVWRQLDTRHVRIFEGKSLAVEIEKSPMGGYWMKIENAGSPIRVERLK